MSGGAGAAVAVVMVNWNGGETTLRALDAARRLDPPASSLLLVDNASRDHVADSAAACGVTVLRNAENLGFSGGCNVGIRTALEGGAEWVLLLNPDAEPEPALLANLLDAAGRDPTTGVIGPLVYRMDARDTLAAAGASLVPNPLRTAHRKELPAGGDPVDVDYVPGCALMVRRRTIDDNGLLDPRYFVLWEDADWCARARASGWRVLVTPHARVWHGRSPSFGGTFSPLYGYYFLRNAVLFAKGRRVPRRDVVLDSLRLGRGLATQRIRGPRRLAGEAVARALAHAARGRWGRAPTGFERRALDR